MKLSDAAKKVIALSEVIQKYWETELPKWHPKYPLVNPGEDDPPPPPEEKKLKKFLDRLPDDLIWQLALIWQARWGNVASTGLSGLYQKTRERLETREDVLWALTRSGIVAGELTDGLAELKKAGLDIDHLPLTSVNSR